MLASLATGDSAGDSAVRLADPKNSVVQVITTTAEGMSAGTAWFSSDAREAASKLTHESRVELNGKTMVVSATPEKAKYLFTNLHVVNGATSVSIRFPSHHKRNIPVDVVGYCDLDVACLRLSGENLENVEKSLGVIPELEMIDSDSVLPKVGDCKKVYIRAYPCGEDDGQFFSCGTLSGLKHAMGQSYLISDICQFNEGVSGGPLFHEGKVCGMNVMKLVKEGVSGMNLHIPSNRIKKLLPYLIDNSENDVKASIVSHLQQAMSHSLPGAADLFLHSGVSIDPVELNRMWDKHGLGGYRSVNGAYEAVSFSDWYEEHVHDVCGSHSLFKKVLEHLASGNVSAVKNMRRFGFENYLCEPCSTSPCTLSTKINLPAEPRVVHLPRYDISLSPGTADVRSWSGSDVCGALVVNDVRGIDLKSMDFLYALKVGANTYDLDDRGEYFDGSNAHSVSDLLSRSPLGVNIDFHVIRGGKKVVCPLKYDIGVGDVPAIHMAVGDSAFPYKGMLFKQLRLQDVQRFGLLEYMNPLRHHEVRFVIAAVDPSSRTFHDTGFQAGHLVESVNGVRPESLEGLMSALTSKDYSELKTNMSVGVFKN